MKGTTKWIITSIVIVIIGLGYFSIFWVLGLSNINITWQIKMDDNTREWLVNHDYCIVQQNQPYDSGKPDIVFMGDCKYFNESILEVTVD